jgi:pyruvate formate lyase activating enzyme
MDAANVDLKAFTEDFYKRLCGGSLQPVLDTLEFLANETDVWIELTTLIIPGENDSDDELDRMSQWVAEHLGPDVPMHFTAFHPDFKMLNTPATPSSTLTRAREIAIANGVRFAYTGNVHDRSGGSTYCGECGTMLIGRDWYQLTAWKIDRGTCPKCGTACPGRFEDRPGDWGPRRLPVRISDYGDFGG